MKDTTKLKNETKKALDYLAEIQREIIAEEKVKHEHPEWTRDDDEYWDEVARELDRTEN